MREMPQSQKTRHHHGEFCIPWAKSARAELPLNYNAILYDEAPTTAKPVTAATAAYASPTRG